MPENTSGRPGAPGPGDSEQWIRDTLARVVDDLAALTCAVADLAKRIGDAEAEAEDILRRAGSSPALARHASPRRRQHRRGDTVLRVVKVAAIAAAGLAAVLALAAPRHMTRDDCFVQRVSAGHCWLPIARQRDIDPRTGDLLDHETATIASR